MNYTLHQLEVFLKVAETGSVTRSAEQLFLSQPAVSIQLKNFQEQFSIPLTRTVGRRIEITDFGMEIARAARTILEEVYAVHYKTQAYQGILAGQLKIATASTGKYVMPFFLSGFLQEHPGIELIMDVTNRDKALQSLERQEVDFALVSVLPDHLQVHALNLMPQRLYLVGSTAGMLSGMKDDGWEKLPLIFREPGSGTRFLMEQYLKDRNIAYRKKIELTSNEAVKQAVRAGLGLSVIPLVSMRHELASGEFTLLHREGLPLETQWQVIYLKHRALLPAPLAWLEYVRRERERLVLNWFGWINDFGQGL